MNRLLLIATGFFLVLSLIGFSTTISGTLTIHAEELIGLAELLGIIMMLVNGTFMETPQFKISLFFIGLIVLGALLKILHYPGADELLLYPFLILFGLYVIHFI